MELVDISTPALLLSEPKVRRNVAAMRARVQVLGVRFRPHVKTCKSIDVAHLMLGQDAAGITVSTLREANYFLKHGVRDITYAVGIAPDKLDEVADLMGRGADVKILLDDLAVARMVARHGEALGVRFATLIEIDSDGHRAGIPPESAELLDIGFALHHSRGAVLAGVLTHAGSSYGCRSIADVEAVAERERSAVVTAAARLLDRDLPCSTVSVGSTPTATFARQLRGVSELRAGVFVFQDLTQAELGVCALDDIAIAVLATVIGYRRTPTPGLIVDAGALALSKDRSTAAMPHDFGYGLAVRPAESPTSSDLIVDQVFQEHGVVISRAGRLDPGSYAIGTRLAILPNHACMTAAAHAEYHVTDDHGHVVGRWARDNGW